MGESGGIRPPLDPLGFSVGIVWPEIVGLNPGIGQIPAPSSPSNPENNDSS